MPDYQLYHMPLSCSRVALSALEELGVPYREHSVALFDGAQRQPDYLAVNWKGKVPVLIADGLTITELPVILYFLANAHPEAALLPKDATGRPQLAALSDVIWLAGALHPLAARIFRPGAASKADPEGVKAIAIKQLSAQAMAVTPRLGDGGWWYGADWSIADSFLAWVFGVAAQSGFPLADFPALQDHGKRAMARPSYQRTVALERNVVARDTLKLPADLLL